MSLNKKERRAKSLVAMGLVKREGDMFTVETPSLRGEQAVYNIGRNASGSITCDCVDYKAIYPNEPNYRCEHIMAVKEFLISTVNEPTKKEKIMSEQEKPKYFEVGERSINEIVRDLSQTIPQSMLKSKKLSGNTIEYISWSDATRLLDAYAPGWGYEVVSIQHIKEMVVLTVQLNIPTKDGIISRQATGNESDVTSSYGDPFSNSESMALRRAAAKFGLCRYMYSKK